jgi:death-on-curing protein
MIKFATVNDVIFIHDIAISTFGGMKGIRNMALLCSAVDRQRNAKFYIPSADIFYISSALMVGIIKNHPFFDGNKRTGAASALSVLRENSHTIHMKSDEILSLAKNVAIGYADEVAVSEEFRKIFSRQNSNNF